jgi:hypothetical protein
MLAFFHKKKETVNLDYSFMVFPITDETYQVTGKYKRA